LEDKFETLDPAWGFEEQDPARSNGPEGLVYSLQPNDSVRSLNQSDLYENYEVCAVFATKVPADAKVFVSVNFWASDNDNKYGADIFPALGTFDVYRVQNKKFLTPVSPKSDPAISKGTDVTNEISVTVKGNKGTLAINDKKVIEFTGQPPEGGSQFGFWVGADKGDTGPSTVTLKSIQLREIGSTPTPVGQQAEPTPVGQQAEAHACGNGKVIFEDKFETLDPSWGAASDNKKVENSALVISPPQDRITWAVNQSDFYTDAAVCVDATVTSTSDPNASFTAIVFWQEDDDNYWEYGFWPTGAIKVIHKTKGKSLYPFPQTETAALKKGIGQANSLEVETKGNKVTLYLNGTKVGELKGKPPEGGGRVGFEVYSPKTGDPPVARFTNFVIAEPR
jgi:hypothetical protein